MQDTTRSRSSLSRGAIGARLSTIESVPVILIIIRFYLPVHTSLQVVKFFRIVVKDSIFVVLANVGLLL